MMRKVVNMCIFYLKDLAIFTHILMTVSCTSIAYSDHCAEVPRSSQNLYLANSAFYFQTPTSVQQCGRLCLQFTLCKSVSIKDFGCRLNYLNATMYPNNLMPLPGAVYMGKSEIKNMLSDIHELHTICEEKCADDRRCVISKSKQPICISIEYPKSESGIRIISCRVSYFCTSFDFSSVTNVATGKKTGQSPAYSEDNNTFVSSYAVDGNYGTDLFIHRCSRTQNVFYPYWYVDLGLPYLVNNITVLNGNEAASTLKNAVITIYPGLQNYGSRVYASYNGPANAGELLTFTSSTPKIVRGVVVQLHQRGHLTLCEVSVYASFIP